jgi:hypothetical protein
MSDELDRPSEEVASPSGQGEVPAPVGGDSLGRGVSPESAGPDRTTRYLDTARGVLSYSTIVTLLAEQVLRLR